MAIVGNWIPSGNDQVRLTNQLRAAVQSLASAASQLTLISNTMSQMAPASDFTTVETYFSIPTGSGSAVSAIIGTASATLAGANVQPVLQRLL